jgi:hypothetical protein
MENNYQQHSFSGKYQHSLRLSDYQYQLFMSALQKPRAKIILNELKQEAMTNTISALFGKLFPNAPYTKQLQMLIYPVKDVSFEPNFKLAELGVTGKTIIRKLMVSHLLLENFYELKHAA